VWVKCLSVVPRRTALGSAVCQVLTAFTHGWTRPLLFATYWLIVSPESGKNNKATRRGWGNLQIASSVDYRSPAEEHNIVLGVSSSSSQREKSSQKHRLREQRLPAGLHIPRELGHQSKCHKAQENKLCPRKCQPKTFSLPASPNSALS